ncbi:MAG TPA: phosphate ABC transporter substrate-binding protein [Patescibacteria group bacterium]|nr:phosphate ABC transporter substrate-binding protein [Patescibacteria group bacterium]
MKRKFTAAALIFCMVSAFFVNVYAQKKAITIKGSDTMVILVQRWTELFRNKEKVDFQVTGGGSGTGIAALINGTTDICASSRPIKPAEVQQLKDKFNTKGVEVRVARDGIAIYAHKKNPVSKLTMQQIQDIFMGKITNWKEVGGQDKKITLYSRENNSGTYEFFKEHVLQKKDFAASAQNMPGTAALINAISKDQYGIGFGGAAYAKDVKELAVGNEKGQFVEPTEANILSGKYPISRFLYFYLKNRPEGDMKKFVDWVISKEGQKVVTEVGYFPIKK